LSHPPSREPAPVFVDDTVVVHLIRPVEIFRAGELQLPRDSLMRRTVHALALAPSGLTDAELIAMGGPSRRDSARHALSQRIVDINNRLGPDSIVRVSGRFVLGERVTVDVLKIIDLVAEKRYDEARQLLTRGRFVAKLDMAPRSVRVKCSETMVQFDQACNELRGDAPRLVLVTRKSRERIERDLSNVMSLPVARGVPGGPRVRAVRRMMQQAPLPWIDHHRGTKHALKLLIPVLENALRHEKDGDSRVERVFLCGGPGSGKSLLAAMTFLALAKTFLDSADDARTSFTPLLFDVSREMRDPDFGTDRWLARLYRDLSIRPGLRPIFVLQRVDALLSQRLAELDAVLRWRLFNGVDALFACQWPFFARHLERRGVETRLVRLEPWGGPLQLDFASHAHGTKGRDRLAAWHAKDPQHVELTSIPLHLVQVGAALASDQALGGIRNERHLYREVAKLRIRRDAISAEEADARMATLGALAHEFYDETRAAALKPIEFSSRGLRDWLQERGHNPAVASAWLDVLENHTLLDTDFSTDHIGFENPRWGWYFVAFYIAEILEHRPEQTLLAFRKFLTTDVTNFLVGMLGDVVERRPERARNALSNALLRHESGGLPGYRMRIAREQAGYFLGTMQDPAVVDFLEPMIVPGSAEFEDDPWVRRGISFGLADGDRPEFADRYVEALRAEVGTDGPTPERDTNIGFHLTFRGDQPLRVDRIDEIGEAPSCTQTVTELVRGLSEDHHRGSWRIKAFTLIDLSRHPKISRHSYRVAIHPHVKVMRSVVAALKKKRLSANWPELQELSEMLETIEGRATSNQRKLRDTQ
jgi:hypothetical protein